MTRKITSKNKHFAKRCKIIAKSAKMA